MQQDNLSKAQRTALKQLKNGEQMKVYPFDKGIGFELLNDIGSISKMEEQLGNTKIIDCDPTNFLAGKFQRHLRKIKKEGIHYPSDCISPRLYGTLKDINQRKTTP